MDFINNKETNALDEDRIVSEIHSIKPQMTFLIICYSHFLDLKSLLERAGLFPTMRMNRDLNILSNGQILTMNDVQKEFIETMTHFWIFFKELLWFGIWGVQKGFNFLPFLDFFKRTFVVWNLHFFRVLDLKKKKKSF